MIETALLRYNENGALDPSFGNGGVALSNHADCIRDFELLPDGKIIAVTENSGGSWSPPQTEIRISRFNSNGSLDASYAIGGMASFSRTDHYLDGWALALDGDLRPVIGGSIKCSIPWDGLPRVADNTYTDFALVRLDTFGSPDTTFGDNGLSKTSTHTSLRDHPFDVAVIPGDGRLIVAGVSEAYSGRWDWLGLTRLFPDGSIDTTFGIAGRVVLETNQVAFPVCIALDDENRTFAFASVMGPSGNYDFAVWRFLPDGTWDTSFGEDTSGDGVPDGVAYQDFGGIHDVLEGAVLQADGRILLAGRAWDPFGQTGNLWDIVLTRLMPNGSVDASFGQGGVVTMDFGQANENIGRDIYVLEDGRILAVAASTAYPDKTILLRFLPDGTPDHTFGSAGMVVSGPGHTSAL
jgi:uncharacterized delta-60 repeat protein